MGVFEPFPKMARLHRECVITEKIDGTNAQVIVEPFLDGETMQDFEQRQGAVALLYTVDNTNTMVGVYAGSRTRLVQPGDDNYGFGGWVYQNGVQLANSLGQGRHFGEWWGSGIQAGYGLPKGEKRFSLFNTGRWTSEYNTMADLPSSNGDGFADKAVHSQRCNEALLCYVVPILYKGEFNSFQVNAAVDYLRHSGSEAVTGNFPAEGIVCYHSAANTLFKVTCENDSQPKSRNQKSSNVVN